MGNNIFPNLPKIGMQRILHLKTFNNPKLREFPPPETFPRIQVYEYTLFTKYKTSKLHRMKEYDINMISKMFSCTKAHYKYAKTEHLIKV